MDTKPMPFAPEPLEALQQRFPEIYKHPVNPAAPNRIVGLLREHVFDLENGIRIIASVDCITPDTSYLHFSVGMVAGKCALSLPQFMALADKIPMTLADRTLALKDNWSTNKACHFLYALPLSADSRLPWWAPASNTLTSAN